MAGGSNKVHRKKRISKHVLESQKRREEEEQPAAVPNARDDSRKIDGPVPPVTKDGTTDTSAADTSDKNPARKKRKNKKRTRDPLAGHAYLSTWKHRSSGEGVWKFNKNTQSWLIKNMYDCDAIPKATFTLLVGYIEGLKGEAMRKRVQDDAVRRALRYKNWEKSHAKDDEGEVKGDEQDMKVDDGAKQDAAEEPTVGEEEEKDEEARWQGFNAHDKRIEYKRARKIIDSLKAITGTS